MDSKVEEGISNLWPCWQDEGREIYYEVQNATVHISCQFISESFWLKLKWIKYFVTLWNFHEKSIWQFKSKGTNWFGLGWMLEWKSYYWNYFMLKKQQVTFFNGMFVKRSRFSHQSNVNTVAILVVFIECLKCTYYLEFAWTTEHIWKKCVVELIITVRKIWKWMTLDSYRFHPKKFWEHLNVRTLYRVTL